MSTTTAAKAAITAENDALRPELQGLIRTLTEADFEQDKVSAPAEVAEGDVVYVHAMGAWRRGLAVKVAKVRVTVAYTTASSDGRIFRKAQKPADLYVVAEEKPAKKPAKATPKKADAKPAKPAAKKATAGTRAVPEKAANRARQRYLSEVGMDRYRQQYNAGWDQARYGTGAKKAASGTASVAWMDGFTDAKACDGKPAGKWEALRATTAPIKKVETPEG